MRRLLFPLRASSCRWSKGNSKRRQGGEAVTPFRPWQLPHPESWCEIYAVILTMLVGFLAVAFLLDWLKDMI